MKLIVGLGNPGDKYKKTRHNLGFMVLDEFAKKRLPSTVYGNEFWKYEDKFKAEVGKLQPEGILLVKPQTYMNNSGLAIKILTTYYKLPITNLVVIHDELDLPLGKIKIRVGGSAAGHHGVESIIQYLKDDQFTRLRLGMGNLRSQSGERGGQHFDSNLFVTSPFKANEKTQVKHMIKKAVEALDLLLEEGLEKAQNQYN